jgi:hypothetical protein
VSIRDQHK